MFRFLGLALALALTVSLVGPSFAQGPHPGSSADAASSGPFVVRTKSAGAPLRVSGDTAASNAPIKSTPSGSLRGPIDIATDLCAPGTATDACPTMAKK